jgi:TRAP-type C4-dicarboxylate transport system permease small subunit
MKRLIRIIDGISSAGGGLAGLMLCVGLLIACTEIILRTAFAGTLFITEEYSGYLMCGLTFCGLGYTLREKGHIRMIFLHRIVRGKYRGYLDLVCYAAVFIFCAVITGFTGEFFWDSVVTKSRSMQISETYLAVPQFLGEFFKTILIIRGETNGITVRKEAEDLGR